MRHEHGERPHPGATPPPTPQNHPAPSAGAKAPARHDHAAMMADPAHAKAMEADMRRRFLVALVFTAPIVLLAGHLPGLTMLVEPPLSSWLGLLLSTPVVWWCGWIFISGGYYALARGKLDMSVLIATGVPHTACSDPVHPHAPFTLPSRARL